MELLAGKVAVITGGASGIGAATVRKFVDAGAKVVIADLQDDLGADLADAMGDAAIYQHTDVTDEAQVQALVAKAVDHYGQLDVMFNNAGIPGPIGSIEETSVEDYQKTMNVNVLGVFLGIKHAAPIMREQGGGSIINTASVAGLEATHAPHIYTGAKAAVINLTRSVAIELGRAFVRVNAICPGGIATPIFARTFDLDSPADAPAIETMNHVLKNSQPIPRAGQPDDIANAAVFLASDLSTFVSGHALVVDGGLTTGRIASWEKWQAGFDKLGDILQDSTSG